MNKELEEAKAEIEHLKKVISIIEETTHIGVWRIDIANQKLTWSKEVFLIHGLEVGEPPAIDQAINYYAPECRAEITRAIEDSLKTHEPWNLELQLLTSQGQRIWVNAQGYPEVTDGKVHHICGIFKNIENEVRQRETLKIMAMLAEKTINGVVLTDADRKIIWVNESFKQLTEFEHEDMIGKNPGVFLQGQNTDPKVVIAMREALDLGESHQAELVNYSKTGKEYVVRIDIQPIYGPTGNLTNFMAIETDVTPQKTYEAELLEAKERAEHATAAKSLFLATMSHEIRTPMNGVLGMSQLLMDEPLSAEQMELVTTIYRSGEALLTIINDILDFSKIEAGKLDIEMLDFSIKEACNDVFALFHSKSDAKNITLRFHLDYHLSDLYHGDSGRIRQILLNLISNSIKFTERGGVDVNVNETLIDDQEMVIFRVSDSGLGMSEEVMSKLFQKFTQADASTTRKFGGTGLGLAISRELCSLMGGEMGVESKLGVGSSFWFRLPIKRVELDDRMISPLNATDRETVWVWNSLTPEAMDFIQQHLQQSPFRTERVDAYETLTFPDLDLDESISPVPKMVALLDNDNLGELERFKDFVKKSSGIKILVILNHPKRGDAKVCQDLGSCAFLAFPFKGEDLSRMLVALNHWKVGDELITQYGLSPLVEQAQAAKSRRKLKILIVEDNIINQRVASKMLKRMNHVTDLAANGLEALAMLDQFDYDLILMDCHMPEMDGYEATLNIRGRLDDKANVAIVAMTANAMEADVKRCYDVGMDEFISKPVKRELLDHTLQHIKLKRNLILV